MQHKFNSPHFFFTIDVEEWFASKLFETSVKEKEEKSDFEEPMIFLLNLLKEMNIKGTFFYIYHTATKYPNILEMIKNQGHEISLHGENHDNIQDLGEDEFRKMLHKMKKKFKTEFQVDLKGYRAPHFGVGSNLQNILNEEGFSYDSSVVPCLPIPRWYGNPKTPLRAHRNINNKIWEFPISVYPYLRIPGAGGYYFRNLGKAWTNHILSSTLRSLNFGVFYIHPWELSNKNPKRQDIPFYTFRRTGDWTRENLRKTLEKITKIPRIQCKTIRETINDIATSND